jgi:uncharacterized protein YecE (DUF72 family)
MRKLFVGTSGWAYSSWKPDFYPPKTPATKFLSYYASQLNSVEVNYTFRTWASAKALKGWCDAVPDGFSFAVKAHQRITHIKRLKDVAADVTDFCKSVSPLSSAGKLGPILFQLPPYLKLDEERLRSFLGCIPSRIQAAIEFRNESWFTSRVFDTMREHDVALCVAESDELQVPEVVTASFAYFRFRRSQYSELELLKIERCLRSAAQQCDVFAFLKHEETAEGALNARRILARVGQRERIAS